MIRINLLPARRGKKNEMGRQSLAIGGGALLLVMLLNFFWYNSRSAVVDRGTAKITETQQRISDLERVIGEVNDINRRKKDLEDKLKVLDALRRGRSGPVRLFDALATATPRKVWLKEFEDKEGAVKILGMGMNHEDVAEFMRGLANMVWTSRGMGRLVEQKREAKSSRVELIASGTIEDLSVAEVKPFFTNIDLKRAEQKEEKVGNSIALKTVEFEITLNANYAI